MTQPIDLVDLKRTHREQWSISAVAWDRWWPVFERGAQCVNDALVEMAQLGAGVRVLDVASGLGEPTFTASREVGPGGVVVGVDLAAAMLDFSRGRARARGIRNAAFVEADGENLPFRDASFDAAISRWGVMLMPTPTAAARSIRRVVRPGGRFATAVWSTAEDVPFIALGQRLAERELRIEPAGPDTPGPLRMGREGALEACLEAVGWTVVGRRVVPVVMTFDSPREYVRFQREMSGTLKRALESEPQAVQERVWAILEAEAARYQLPDGRVRFENLCRLAVATA